MLKFQNSSHLTQVWFFIVVGCLSAAIHASIVILLVQLSAIAPLIANVWGWLTAFMFSFCGHYFFTFKNQGASIKTALPRFFMLSLGGFLINETAYYLLLVYVKAHYVLSLALVLIGVALITYFLSRRWAFFRT